MFGIRYRKANPTDYVLHFSRGRLAREGAGLSFFYFAPSSTIVSVPVASANIPFVFQEPTADFQTVTAQGQLTYRIADPKKAAAMLDFTLDARGKYSSDQYQKLPERLVYHLQTLLRGEIQVLPLGEALVRGDALASRVLDRLKMSPEVMQLGVEVLNLAILSLKPTPETAKALEAEAREALNRKADDAVYARRNSALEQEGRLKENELQNELLVQTKQREIRERELEAEIVLEKQRAALTDQKVENDRKEADSRAYSLTTILSPIQGVDWRVLMMLTPHGDARNTIALAFQDLAANAQKIGELNITPDLLRTLISTGDGQGVKAVFEKIVLVTRKTRLEELVDRFNTRPQAKFYIEHSGGDFQQYVGEHDQYQRALEAVRRAIERGLKVQVMDRTMVPTYIFTAADLVVTLGQDGLVANTAKYVKGQPIVAVNPDPDRFDGVLLPFQPAGLIRHLDEALAGRARLRAITLAEATLKDGQRLLAFNDLFVGAQSHISARYRIEYRSLAEQQSSSGILVSTGAGSTGWLSSVYHQASGILAALGREPIAPARLEWEEQKLLFMVREPFVSRHSQAGIVTGAVAAGEALRVESQMPSAGVIFSDGVEADHLDFNSGAIATIGIAPEKANLVVP